MHGFSYIAQRRYMGRSAVLDTYSAANERPPEPWPGSLSLSISTVKSHCQRQGTHGRTTPMHCYSLHTIDVLYERLLTHSCSTFCSRPAICRVTLMVSHCQPCSPSTPVKYAGRVLEQQWWHNEQRDSKHSREMRSEYHWR